MKDRSTHSFKGAAKETERPSIEQDVSGFQVGKSYILSFESAGIEGFSGANPFFVSLGGNAVTFDGSDLRFPLGQLRPLLSATPFIATSSTMTLRFHDAGNVPAGFASWIDDVQITAVPEPSTGVSLLGLTIISLIAGIARRSFR